MGDFEIEAEEEYEEVKHTDFQWNNGKDTSKRSNNFFSFGTNCAEEDNGEDYMYDLPTNHKLSQSSTKKGSPLVNNSIAEYKVETNHAKEHTEITQKSSASNSNSSALEKAQQMLNKYSSKPQPQSIVHSKYAARKFDEDALSLESDEDDENDDDQLGQIGMNESDESESFVGGKVRIKVEPSVKKINAKGSNDHGSPVNKGKKKSVNLEVSVFEGDEEDGDEPEVVTPYAFPAGRKGPPHTLKDETDAYSEEEFDEEVEDSVTADKSNHGSGKNGNLSIAENSFSRLDYNEDLNESVEEVNDNIEDVGEVSYGSHNMLSTSRQKVLSFTDLSTYAGWSSAELSGSNAKSATTGVSLAGKGREERISEDVKLETSTNSYEATFEHFSFNEKELTSPLSDQKNLPTPTHSVREGKLTISMPQDGQDTTGPPKGKGVSVSEAPANNQQQQYTTSSVLNQRTGIAFRDGAEHIATSVSVSKDPVVHAPYPTTTPITSQAPAGVNTQETNAVHSVPPNYAAYHPYSSYPPPFPYQPPYPPHLSPYPGMPSNVAQYPHPQQMQSASNPPYPPPPNFSPYYPYPPPHSYSPYYPQYPPPPPPTYLPPEYFARPTNSNYGGGLMNPFQSGEQLYRLNENDHRNRDRSETVKQPIMVDLLQELRKSKEEAEWAKQKLAETIVLAGRKDRECQLLEQTLRTSSASSVKPATPRSRPRKSASPVVKSSKEAFSPKKSRSMAVDAEASIEDAGDEYDDEEYENEYSDDFEESNASFRKGLSPRKQKAVDKEVRSLATKNQDSLGATDIAERLKISIEANASDNRVGQPNMSSSSSSSSSSVMENVDTYQQEVERQFLAHTERALYPLRSTLSQSILSSQELFRNQIESLRMRLQMSTGGLHRYSESRSSTTRDPWLASYSQDSGGQQGVSGADVSNDMRATSAPYSGRYGNGNAPSLAEIKSEFKAKKEENTRKLFDIITKVYPHIDPLEAIKLAELF